MPETSWTTHRARVAALSRDRAPDDPELINARRDLAACRLEEYVTKLIDGFPPLTQEQRDRIAALLRPARRRPRSTTKDGGDSVRNGGTHAA